MVDLVGEDKIEKVKGVGEKTAQLLRKLSIETVGDLIRWFPREYDQFHRPIQVRDVKSGEKCAIWAAVVGTVHMRQVRNLLMTEVTVKDTTGSMGLIFFNSPYLRGILKSGIHFIFRGVVTQRDGHFVMEQPKIFSKEEYEEKMAAIQPCYGLTKGLTNGKVQKIVKEALQHFSWEEDPFPEEFRQQYQLITEREAIQGVHFPQDEAWLVCARRRMSFEEFFLFFYQMQKGLGESSGLPNTHPISPGSECTRFLEALPFGLTDAQKKVWQEISSDLGGAGCMNRLLQGDVGSGKTIIAVLALLACAEAGYQGALMVPTEVLAQQHYQSVLDYISLTHIGLRPVLLTGSLTAKEKKAAYGKLASGEANLVIGTHAVIQDKVIFSNLALVVTDEQHRFGVRQRENLAQKGNHPHVLVMSATPIPRTLAITLYGSLPISVIDELPKMRLPIKSCVVNTSYRPIAYRFLEKEVGLGHQVYVICPLVEEGENGGEGENVGDYAEKLKSILSPHIRIAVLHGKMRPGDKNHIMEAFGAHEIDILVSTTVIEVGINVPNATVMLIENAERFGLAQLHQLRGRVGRGKTQSFCIFISTKEDKETMERLGVLLASNDGFVIAAKDLALRGPGDMHTPHAIRTIRQSGEFAFQFGDIYEDADLLALASQAVKETLAGQSSYKNVQFPLLQRSNEVDFPSI
jgi:ATP-dependent DNA helicase RecG